EHAQDRLLGALGESNIVLGISRDLRLSRKIANAPVTNRKHLQPTSAFVRLSNEDKQEREGINSEDPANKEMLRLREALKPFQELHNNKLEVNEIEHHWSVIQQCEAALARYSQQQPKMAQDLWGHLVSACESIVGYVTSWPRTSEQWKTLRKILLKASIDRFPEGDNGEEADQDSWPSWGWPAPRLDAACGLPFLAHRLGHADEDVSSALRRLCQDKSRALRFNLAERLWVLEQPEQELMWELIDAFVTNEQKFSVLDALLGSLDRLWTKVPEKVRFRVMAIADCSIQRAPASNHIHEMLAHTCLFRFLRTGDS